MLFIPISVLSSTILYRLVIGCWPTPGVFAAFTLGALVGQTAIVLLRKCGL